MAKREEGNEIAVVLIGGLIAIALVVQAVIWIWNWFDSRGPLFWFVLFVLAALLAAGAWYEDESKAEKRSVGAVVGLVLVALLFVVLGSCTAVQDHNAREDAQESLAKQSGGSVLVAAPEDACWVLTAYDAEQAAAMASDNKAKVNGMKSSSPASSDSAAPQSFEGCGTEIEPLPTDQIFAAVNLDFDDDDDHHPLMWAAFYWFTRDHARRGGALIGGDVSGTTLYGAMPDAAYQSRSGGLHRNKTTDAFGDLSLPRLDKELANKIRAVGGDPDVFADDAEAAAVKLSEGPDDVEREEALTSLTSAATSAQKVVDTATAFRHFLMRGASKPEILRAGAFNEALSTISELGTDGEQLAASMRTVAYNTQTRAARSETTYGSSKDFERALRLIPLLNTLDPSRSADTTALEVRLASGLRAAAAEEAEFDSWMNEVNNGFDYGSGTPCGPGDRDGDGDGICNES